MNLLLIFGAHDITTQESTQIRLTSTQYIIHNGWNSKALKNDIALIKLPSPVNETNYIKPVKIASGKNTFAGSKGKYLLPDNRYNCDTYEIFIK